MGAGTWRCERGNVARGCGNVAARVRERRGRGGLVRRREAVRVCAVVVRRENVLPLRQFARQFAHHASLSTARMRRRRHVPNSRLLQVNASIPRKNLHTHRRKWPHELASSG